jgi:Cu/Ag efflux protein CusF
MTITDRQASLDSIKTGQQVSGEYKQSSENKMELTSLEVFESTGGTGDSSSAESGTSFSGKVGQVDTSSQTVTVDGKTYRILPTSRITKNDQQASLSDLKAGAQVNGQYKKSAENNLEVLSLEIAQATGGTKDNSNADSQSGGNKFSGKVSNVDLTRQRVTIGDRTYQVLPTTTVTLANGKQTSLNNVKPNQQVSGTYKQADSGNYEILSLRVTGNPSRPE